MSSALIGTINGGVIGLVVGAGLGYLHYPIFNGLYTERQIILYSKNGAVLLLTGMSGGICGCIGGAIGGFNSSIIMNDNGTSGGLTGGVLGGLVGGAGSILIDSNK